jgi:hypothetical protein
MTRLGKMCGCGRSISIECPTVADIPAAAAQMEGWGDDERGLVRCPQCLAAGSTAPAAPEPTQPTLFDEAA